jgi:hypothetical protein
MLVDPGKSADHRTIPDLDVTRDARALRQDDPVSDLAVMSHVHLAHYQAVRANPGRGGCRSPVHGCSLPDDRPRAHPQFRRAAVVAQVLRIPADHRHRPDFDSRIQSRHPVHNRMGVETDTAPDDHRAVHHRIRPDAGRIID